MSVLSLLANKKSINKKKIILEGLRVYTRPAKITDRDAWLEIRKKNKDFLMPFEPTWPQKCLTKAFFIKKLVAQSQNWDKDKSYSFLIFLNDNQSLIGGININNVTRGASQFATLGYWLGEEFQGKGFMAEATNLIVGFSFTELGLQRLNAGCLAHNKRSQNMLKNIGFKEEGYAEKYIQINGKRQDHVLFGLNIDDWDQ
jgi:ribosomal-protein-alanine N-acetyltransferase